MQSVRTLVAFLLRCLGNVRFARPAIAAVVVAGIISGAASASFIAIINATLASGSPKRILLAGFIGLCIALPLSRLVSNIVLIRLTNRALMELRILLCRRILASPLRRLEELGAAKLTATLTEDVGTIVSSITNLPLLTMHVVLVLGCLVYLAALSWRLFLLVLAAVVLGSATYRLPLVYAQKHFRKEREAWDRMFRHFRGVTEGAKELKLHQARRQAFFSQSITPTVEELRLHNVRGNTIYEFAAAWGQVLFFILIGLILFGLQGWVARDPKTLIGYTLTILYMITPLEIILTLLPNMARASVAVDKVESLGLSLLSEPAEAAAPATDERAVWRRIELAQVCHSYRTEGSDEMFMLGPIDLTFRPGELIFVVGGNGSGKTTFAKLLLGLYVPESGELRLDSQRVTDANRDVYRQLFSVVFTDFFLFDNLLGLEGPDLDRQANEHIERLQLAGKLQVRDGVLSTLDLSQGQRKRLALLTAYLEDRPIYLFDEWAADQDPYFKEVFYLTLLPELKARGKTVIVISHDDRYYGAGDRIIRLERGRLEYDRAPGVAGLDAAREPVAPRSH